MNVSRGKVVLKETSAGIPDLIVVVEDVHAVRWAEANGADLVGLQVRRPSPGRHLPLVDPDTKGVQPVTALAVSGRRAPAHPAG